MVVIKEYLITNKKVSTSIDMDLIIEKIYDYIMTKIYKKIFPSTKDKKDQIIENSTFTMTRLKIQQVMSSYRFL